MRTTRLQFILVLAGLLTGTEDATSQDVFVASLQSWQTNRSSQYARIRTNHSAMTLTTWTNATMCQCLPVYADIHWIGYSLTNDSIYVRAPGLPSYTMGPWYLDAGDARPFPNLPTNQHYTVSFPAHVERVSENLTRSSTPVDIAGMFVNGTAMFNMLDGHFYRRAPGNADWNNGSDVQGVMTWSTGAWHRNAYPSETDTFDINNSHQPADGQIHMHINPSGLRAQLDDNVSSSVNLVTGEITNIAELASPTHHSPILGWAFDGFPIYGPYGYSDPTNVDSSVRRLVSGYVLRDGQYGTSNLNLTGRTSLPLWAQEVQGRTTLAAAQRGPDTTKDFASPEMAYTLGRYAEDWDYLGDLSASARAGIQWDLDRCNSRYCVTPEFPAGIYAYFVTINSNGTPAFPYILGPQYCGKVTGGRVASVPDGATEVFDLFHVDFRLVGPELTWLQDMFEVLLTWSGLEGGQYRIVNSDDLQNWTTVVPSVIGTGATNQARFTQAVPRSNRQFWLVVRESLAPYDSDE